MTGFPSHTLPLLDLLGIRIPLIQAPMAGVSTPALALAVSRSGALGSLGLSGGDPASLQTLEKTLKSPKAPPVNLNFFVHKTPNPDRPREARWLARLEPHFETLGAPVPDQIHAPYGSFDDNPKTLDALTRFKPKVVSFHFGLPSAQTLEALKTLGVSLIATATSTAEAAVLVDNGIDAVIAQGWEAGGHRGHFLTSSTRDDERLSTRELVEQFTGSYKVPIIAAGGIGDGATGAELIKLGAAAVQLGTAFICCPESSASAAYRKALSDNTRPTIMTNVFSGREARGLQNRLTDDLQNVANHSNSIEAPAYPIAYAAGKALAAAAEQTANLQHIQNYSAMWAGTAFREVRPLPAATLVKKLGKEMLDALNHRR